MKIRPVFLGAALLGLATLAAPAAEEPIEIIAAFNLTGGSAVLDAPSYNGALLAAETINRVGGVLGRPLELVPVDTESKPDTVAAKVEAALAAHPDAIAGIGYSYSTEALNAGRVFQAKGIPFVSPGATDPSVPAEVGDNMFYAAYGDDAQAAAMAAFVRNQLKLDHAAVWIEDRDLYPRTIGADFPKSFEALGGTIVLNQSDDSADGFADFIDKLKTASPTAAGDLCRVDARHRAGPHRRRARGRDHRAAPLRRRLGCRHRRGEVEGRVARGHLLHHPQFPRRRHPGDGGLRHGLHRPVRRAAAQRLRATRLRHHRPPG